MIRQRPFLPRVRPLVAAAVLACGTAHVAAQETIKIAFIDSLSGPFAAIGQAMLSHVQVSTAQLNAAGGSFKGTQLEILDYDSKTSTQESQSAMQAALDRGAKIIISGGSGSAVIAALVDTANKRYQRDPEHPVIVMNYSSVDPDLTGKNCSFWYFQVEANTAMKMKALSSYVSKLPAVKNVYLFNQDYSHGHQWAKYGREMFAQARPDVNFVGEEYFPLGRVKDFAPYVSKIKAAGADTVITGNWGPDLSLFYRSAADAGLNLHFFNHTAGAQPGMVTTASIAGPNLGQLTQVTEWHAGETGVPQVDELVKTYTAKTGKEFLAPRFDLVPRFIIAAVNKAQSTDVLKIARAMEGLSMESPLGPVRMRAEDHQMLIPQVVNTIAPVDGKTVKVGVEGTQWGFRTDAKFDAESLALPSQCKMVRP
jgi:ABC-type branched-subunit amino acid transport system substrate-binding protein